MVFGKVKIFDNAVDENKLDTTAARVIQLKAGEKFEVKDADGFTLLSADNDTSKVAVKGNIIRV